MPGANRLVATALTHVGAVREHNEDTIAVADWVQGASMAAPLVIARGLEGPTLALVADGMGGHAAGEVASRVAAETLVGQAHRARDEDAVIGLLHEANDELVEVMRERPATHGMGTTVAGVALAGARAIVFNVGDSRVYAVREEGLEQISTDDTPGPKRADQRTAVTTSNLVTQTLGGFIGETIEPHVLALPLTDGAAFLICSDGLSDLVETEEMAGLIGSDDPASVDALFRAAMERGGRDNVSIILLRVRLGGR